MLLADDQFFNDPEFRQMLKTYEEAVSQGIPHFLDADDLVDIADYYRMVGHTNRGIEVAENALELFPHATLPNVFMARIALRNENLDEARHYISMIEAKDDPDYLYIKAELLIYEFRGDRAERLLSEHYDALPPSDRGWFIKDVVNLYLDNDLYRLSYNWLMKYEDEEDNDYLELLGRSLSGIGELEKSEEEFAQLADQNPFEKRFWKLLADTQLAQQKIDEAITSSEYAIAIDPDDHAALALKGNALMAKENWEQAAEFFQQAIRQLPTECSYYLQIASCLINLNDYEGAIEWLDTALEDGEDMEDYTGTFYFQMALCYAALRNVDAAKYSLDMAEDWFDDKTDIYVARGHILQIAKHYKMADRFFAKAMEMSVTPMDTLLRVAVSMTDSQRYKECITLLKSKLPIMDERCTDGLSILALCCMNLHQTEDFLHYLRLAAERNPAELRAILGDYFPEDMPVKDYYAYAYQRIHNKNQS